MRLFICLFLLSEFALAHDINPHEAESEGLRLSGYGSLGYATDNQDQIAPIRDISQQLKEGYLTGNSWKLDSRLAVQVDYRFSPKTEFVAQAVLRDQVVNSLDTAVELAYVGIAPTPNWDIRAGRFGYDIFLLSDHRNLGYSYSWIRPPEVYYSWIPLFSVDGIDAAYKFQSGETRWRVKGQLGQSHPSVAIGHDSYQAETDGLYSLSISRESGYWRAKAGFSNFKVGNEVATLAPLHAELERLAATGNASIREEATLLRQEIGFKGAKKNFLSLGIAYDDGVWLGQAELAITNTNKDFFSASDAAYVSLGRRMGKLTPFIIVSGLRPNTSLYAPITNWGKDEPFHSVAIHTANSTRMDQTSMSLGLRWDIHDQAALKLQWSTTHINAQGYGLWWRPIDFNRVDNQVHALSASFDFVF